MFHNSPKAPPRQAKPGEILFTFVRASDHAPISSNCGFTASPTVGKSQFLEAREFLYGHGAFATRGGLL